MIANPFQTMSAIFSEISQHSRFSFKKYDDNAIASLASEIISILKHPRNSGLKTSDLFLLKDRMALLRESPLGNNFEYVLQKIERAIYRYGKHLLINRSVIEKRFPKEMHYLVDVFYEEDDEKIPLALAYRLHNLHLLSLKGQELSLFVSMILKTSKKTEYLSLISKHILTHEDPIPFLQLLDKQKDGGFNLLKHAALVFEFHQLSAETFQLLPSQDYFISQLFLLEIMALFFETEQDIDKTVFIKLFSKKTYTRNLNFREMITQIPKERRLPALLHAAKFFSDDLDLWEKLSYVLEVSLSPENKGDPLKIAPLFNHMGIVDYYFAIENIPLLKADNDFKKELLEDGIKIAAQTADRSLLYDHYIEEKNAKRACKILNILFKIEAPRDKRASRLDEIEKMLNSFERLPSGKEIATYLHALCQTTEDSDMRDAMQGVYRLLNAKIYPIQKYFLSAPYSLVSSLPLSERDYFIDLTLEAAKHLEGCEQFKKNDILACLFLLSEEERSLFMSTFPDIVNSLPIQISNNYGIEFALYFSAIKTETGKKKHLEKIIAAADQKISSGNISKEALMILCRYLYSQPKAFQLFDQHPLMIKVVELLTLENERGLKNPFLLRKKLIELSNQPLDYQPACTIIEGTPITINLKTFQEMSLSAPIHRMEIPEEATLEAFDTLIRNLSSKYKKDPQAFETALKGLNPDLTWASLSLESTLITLRGLLSLMTEIASDDEAKWRKILANILSKSAAETGVFFTEQECVQITTQYMIQQCPIGIHGGIDDAYQSIPSHLKYQSKSLPPKSSDSLLHDFNQNNALQYLSQRIDPQIPFDDLCIRLVKEDPKKLISLLPSLIGYDLKFWDVKSDPLEDPLAEWHLTLQGAKAALHKALKTKDHVHELLLPILREFIAQLFNRGNDKVIQSFIKDIDIKQSIHQSTYIKHLIGHILGLPKEIQLDRHSGLIYQQLLDASVNEVLDAFFLHHPPVDFVHEVMRAITLDHKNALPPYFHNPTFWNETGVTTLGALELLLQGEFFTNSSNPIPRSF